MVQYDIIIIGGQSVGMAFASKFKDSDLKIAIIEKNPKITSFYKPCKLFAISLGSAKILSHIIDDWHTVAQPINRVEVMERSQKAYLHLDPREIDQNEFGFMIEEEELYNKLYNYILAQNNIDIIHEESIHNIIMYQHYVEIITESNKSITTSLLVGADGKTSKVRDLMNIDYKVKEYHETCLVFELSHSYHHNAIAYENFLQSGPFGILPRKNGFSSSIVWTVKNNIADAVKILKEEEFISLCKDYMPDCLGRIEAISKISSFPLSLIYTDQAYKERAVLIGDALHAIHPLAGQGLNLGIRDLETLYQLIMEYKDLGMDIGSSILLNRFAHQRNIDNKAMIYFTDLLSPLFQENNYFTFATRRLGIPLFNSNSYFKKYIMKYASGLL